MHSKDLRQFQKVNGLRSCDISKQECLRQKLKKKMPLKIHNLILKFT